MRHVLSASRQGAPATSDRKRASCCPGWRVDRSPPTPAECDLTVVLLWSRMGTPDADLLPP